MRRIAVVGTTGAGKTVLAARLAALLDLPHIELDALFHGPNWTPAPLEEFRARVAAALAADGFVVDGNYGASRDLVWPRLDTVVWLDYGFPLIFRRLVRRTVGRIATGEPLWNGNRESFRGAFLSRESILLWALTTHRRRTRELPLLARRYAVPNLVRLRSPHDADAWLRSIAPVAATARGPRPGAAS